MFNREYLSSCFFKQKRENLATQNIPFDSKVQAWVWIPILSQKFIGIILCQMLIQEGVDSYQ